MGDIFKILLGTVAVPLVLGGAVLAVSYATQKYNIDIIPALSFLVATSPIWLPLLLFTLLRERWMEYVRTKFAFENGRTTLRIKLPQDVFKSPEAMESVMAQIYNPNGPDNLWQAYIDGKHPLTFSFELVSIGGDVRFYINVPTKKTRNSIEAQLYGQYPGIEIVEEPIDYTAEVVGDLDKWEMMAFHINKKNDQEFPIKTYIEFGLDKMPKEEEKFEPMAAMIEQLGNIKSDERIWIQILAKPHDKKSFKTGDPVKKGTWEEGVFAKIDEIMKRNDSAKVNELGFREMNLLTKGEGDMVATMERNVGKYAYEVAIRLIYAAPVGRFQGDSLTILKSFTQYDIIKRNGLGVRWRTDFDYNWFSDRSGAIKRKWKKEELEYYKLRAYEQRDKKGGADKTKVWSVEELATIYHIPGRSVITPGLARIPSTRQAPPPNLPTGLPGI